MKKILVISTLSLALMSGAAFAQAVVSGNVGSGTSAQAPAPANPDPTAQQIGEAVGNAANDVGRVVGEAATDVAREINESANSYSPETAQNSGLNPSEEDAPLDGTTTASINSSTQLGITLDAIGANADAFFADETRAEVVGDDEFAAAFNSLTIDQQAELRTSCQDAGSAGGAAADFCAAVSAL